MTDQYKQSGQGANTWLISDELPLRPRADTEVSCIWIVHEVKKGLLLAPIIPHSMYLTHLHYTRVIWPADSLHARTIMITVGIQFTSMLFVKL